MPDGTGSMTVGVLGAIGDIDETDWNACAGTDQPFCTHAFLSTLEDSGSAVAKTGWRPQHLVLKDGNGRLLGCVPLYLKTHSYGEYVFDWGWAEAYERSGGRYYPKLQAAIPFTPVPGPRLLIRADAPSECRDILAAAMVRLAERFRISSAHVTFSEEREQQELADQGFLLRTGYQYHWHNRNYAQFDDFLAQLSSRKRKAIRKERAKVADADIVVRTLMGGDIGESHWNAFYDFYLNTVDRKWAHAYLTREFFLLLGERLSDQVMLMLAETTRGEPVAGALHVLGRDALYGRYWGCTEHFRFLHFELCYYRAIDFAIERGLARVEAGAQGEHKIQRGYLPVPTHSAHWIADSAFRAAVERFLVSEKASIAKEMATLATLSPYRCDDTGES